MSEPCQKEETFKEIRNNMSSAFEEIRINVRDAKSSQDRMTEAMIDLARQQEKIVSLADKTEGNKEDIEKAFVVIRKHDSRITTLETKLAKGDKPGKDSKFGKVEVAVVIVIITTVLHSLWDILSGLVTKVSALP